MKRAIVSFLFTLAIVSMAASVVQAQFDINPVVIMLFVLGAIGVSHIVSPNMSRHVQAGVEREAWVDYIMKRFWKDNAFLKNFYNDDQYVVAGKIVHIPQPGAKPTIVKNRSSFPATAVRRTDTDITYTLDSYTTDPTHITNAEEIESSYDKQDSVLGDHIGVLNDTIADDFIIKILATLPGAMVLDTTGGSVAVGVSGQTGTRKLSIHQDLRKGGLAMNLQNIPKNDRFAMYESNMLDQLIESLSANQYADFSRYVDAANGVIGRLYGFNILERSSVAVAATALSGGNLSVNALGASVSATDDTVSLLWQKDAAARAIGDVNFFENKQDALYYGDVYSGEIRVGGRRRRSDGAGIIALKQGHTS